MSRAAEQAAAYTRSDTLTVLATDFAKLVTENERKDHQIRELQAANTELVKERRVIDGTSPVREFFVMAGQRLPTRVGDVEESELRVGATLLAEEALETLEAVYGSEALADTRVALLAVCAAAPIRLDLEELVDGCCDLRFVTHGLLLRVGVNERPHWALVCEKNAQKAGGPRRADGKLLKPIGWTPPDHRPLLVAQGWVGA